MRVFKQSYSGKNKEKLKTKKWYVEFRDHLSITRRVPGFTDKKATAEMGRKIEKMVSMKSMNQPYDAELVRWLETIQSDLRKRLAKFGLIEAQSVARSVSVEDHLKEYQQYLKVVRNATERFVKELAARITAIADYCNFKHLTDLDAGKITNFLSHLQAKNTGAATQNHY